MDLDLQGRRFLIGGGSRGLGFATAESLAADGAEVILVGRDEETLRAAAERLGGGSEWVAADLFSAEGRERILSAITAPDRGPLSGVLVNGGGPPAGEVLDLDADQWRASYELLLGGPIELIRALRPHLQAPAAAVFVTSSSVRQVIPGLDTSNVLRPAVAALVKCLGRELAPDLRVNAIAPGRFATDRVRELDTIRAERRGVSREQVEADTRAAIPVGRYGDPAEFGRLAAFLLSPAASFCNGTLYQADGGMVTALP